MQQSPATSAPSPDVAPAPAPATAQPVTGDGVPLAATGPAAILEGLKAQREELRDQLSNVSETRSSITSQLRRESLTEVERTGLEQRLASTDQQIATIELVSRRPHLALRRLEQGRVPGSRSDQQHGVGEAGIDGLPIRDPRE